MRQNKKLGSPTKEKNKRKRKHRKQHRENVWDVDNDYEEMVTPAQVTKREPKTTAEKAYPEQMPEQQMQQDAIANQLATDTSKLGRHLKLCRVHLAIGWNIVKITFILIL